MAWVAVAIGGSALVGGYMQGEAARTGANAQTDAANNATQMQWNMYQQGRQDLEPYRQYGTSALDMMNGFDRNHTQRTALQKQIDEGKVNSQNLAGYLANGVDNDGWGAKKSEWDTNVAKWQAELDGLGPAQQFSGAEAGNAIMSQDPGYQFRLDQGNKAINAAGSARGRAMGGRTMKELSRYGQDYASNEYGNAYARLANMAGMGMGSANTLNQSGQNYGAQYGQNQAAIGNANAAGTIGQANGWAGGFQGVGDGVLYGNILKGRQQVQTQVQPYQGYGSAGHSIPVLDGIPV
jgi:hypothetical protein